MKYEPTVNTIEREVLFKNVPMIHIFIIRWFTFISIILYVIL